MKLNPWLVDSLMDTDFYKITMLQAYYHTAEFRLVDVEWKFSCRNRDGLDLTTLIPELNRQLEHLCTLTFTDLELDYLGKFSYIKPDFIEFLRIFKLNMRFVKLQPKGEDLNLRFHGPLLHVTLMEIYALAIISELHTFTNCDGFNLPLAREKLVAKIALIKNDETLSHLKFADFGTRRRASRVWQKEVLQTLKEQLPNNFSGTSNLHFSQVIGLSPIGTMAHEWFQSWQAVTRLADAQKAALEGWVQEYRGRLGIAITDCYSMDSFIRDFSDPYFGKLYDGLRHDSGCPFIWGEKAIKMYQNMGIDPLSKTLVFSDSLHFPRMIEIYKQFKGRIRLSFGIGTNLMNDVGNKPLNIVIKMVAANGKPVAKISDEPGKSMCEDLGYLQYLASLYDIDPSAVKISK
ncbi:nicotinate phosphoribosyltransferase [Psychromonas antarctica]|jgi:nicotinate phosphoribosyltransferase|uniref:nicotinate phosphoribosyltransferase n=1 Tax=Psychromonas antarctica TaxID=67573 RepID=UPI001EE96434|nr:nicotinate phosphoribosyltransferase [Psychromonas antarctica]MCG6202280.1 nicotinate phosphoribosyltransferase [Psychromonas antarctica]